MPAMNVSRQTWANFLLSIGSAFEAKHGLEFSDTILDLVPNKTAEIGFNLASLHKASCLVLVDNCDIPATAIGKSRFNKDPELAEAMDKDPMSRGEVALLHSIHVVRGGLGAPPVVLCIAGLEEKSSLNQIPNEAFETGFKIRTWNPQDIVNHHLDKKGKVKVPSDISNLYLASHLIESEFVIGSTIVIPPFLAGGLATSDGIVDPIRGTMTLSSLFVAVLEAVVVLQGLATAEEKRKKTKSPTKTAQKNVIDAYSKIIAWSWWMMVHNKVHTSVYNTELAGDQTDTDQPPKLQPVFAQDLQDALMIDPTATVKPQYWDILTTTKTAHAKFFQDEMNDLQDFNPDADWEMPSDTADEEPEPKNLHPKQTPKKPAVPSKHQATPVTSPAPEAGAGVPPMPATDSNADQFSKPVGRLLDSIATAISNHLDDRMVVLEESQRKTKETSDDSAKRDPVTNEAKEMIKTLMTTNGYEPAVELTPTMERLLGNKVESARIIIGQALDAKGHLDVCFSSHTAALISRGGFTYQSANFPSGLLVFCFSRKQPKELLEAEAAASDAMIHRLKNEEGQGLNEKDIKKILNGHRPLIPATFHEMIEQLQIFHCVLCFIFHEESLVAKSIQEIFHLLTEVRYQLDRLFASQGPTVFSKILFLIDSHLQSLFRKAKSTRHPAACHISDCLNFATKLNDLQFGDSPLNFTIPQAIIQQVDDQGGSPLKRDKSPNKGGADGSTPKRNKKERIENTNVVSDWKIRPGESFPTVFLQTPANHRLELPQLWELNGKKHKICRNWHILGSCHDGCQFKATHTTIPPGPVFNSFATFVRACRSKAAQS